jgi:hypothetical protein
MAALEATKKLNIYHTLYRLNLSFSNIVSHCRTLQEAGALTSKRLATFPGIYPRAASRNEPGTPRRDARH